MNVSSLDRMAPMIATCAGLGSLQPGPGTWASLATLPAAYLIVSIGGHGLLFVAVLAVFLLGLRAVDLYERSSGRHDPPEVVIDEVFGMGLVLVVTGPHWLPYLIAFMLFRMLDILKPWPIGLVDRQVKGGLGAMLDDGMAALIAAFVMVLLGPAL